MDKFASLTGFLSIAVTLSVLQACQGSLNHVKHKKDYPVEHVFYDEIAKFRQERGIDEQKKKRIRESIERLKEIQRREESKVLAIGGVTSIGIGAKAKGDDLEFVVTIERGGSPLPVPKEIGGVPVRVTFGDRVRLLDNAVAGCEDGGGPPCHTDVTELPVEMGNSARWFLGNGGCTAGFKACDLESGRSVFVTNSHCAQSGVGCGLASVGDAVWHPAWGDAPQAQVIEVGEIAGHAAPTCGSQNNFVDATKVISPFYLSTSDHRDFGPVAGSVLEPLPNAVIGYSGRTSGSSIGFVEAVNVTVSVPAGGGFCCGPLTMREQVSFDPVGLIMGGDSGSGILELVGPLNDTKYLVAGLLWGTNNDLGYFSPLGRVLDALNLTMDFSKCGQ